MILEELEHFYGSYVAERVRQCLTIQAFEELEVEELVSYFNLLAERTYEEYRSRLRESLPKGSTVTSKEEYLGILHRRWQEAEEIAHLILKADDEAYGSDSQTGQSA